MTKLNQILLTVAVAGTITMANSASAQYRAAGGDGIAASPKVRMVLDEQKRNTALISPSTAVADYRAVGADGIAASPKLRQQLDERIETIMVASVK